MNVTIFSPSPEPAIATPLRRLAFISRHAPTVEQGALAILENFDIVHVGDVDAFAPDLGAQIETLATGMDAISCVHTNIALSQARPNGLPVWVWRNENRAPEGERPQFLCTGATIWTWQDGSMSRRDISLF